MIDAAEYGVVSGVLKPETVIVWGTSKLPEINDGIAAFVGARIGSRGFGHHTSMAVLEDNQLLAGVVFHNFDQEANIIQISAASLTERWLTRKALWAIFDYTFNYAACQMVVVRVSERNRSRNGRGIQRMLKAYGFSVVRIENLRGRGIADLIYTLTDEAWAANGFHRQHEEAARLDHFSPQRRRLHA